MVLGHSGLKSNFELNREAAVRAMISLIEFDADRYIHSFLVTLVEFIGNKELYSFSESDILIFQTPEGQLYHNG